MSTQIQKVRHDFIRYANCWEDADVLLEGLKPETGDSILSIGSAGDNSFSLLTGNPKVVVAVDLNEIQLNLIELKRSAFRTLNYDEFLEFLGFRQSEQRSELYQKVRADLKPDLLQFWDTQKDQIIGGIIYKGKFEKYFGSFKSKILPLIHTKKRIDDLFKVKSAENQRIYHDKVWNNFRWRLLFKLFFSRFVMGRFGRDPKFLEEVDVKVSDFILDKANKHLSSTNCQRNYLLYFILKGEFGDLLPHYARKEHFEIIKKNLDRLIIYHGLAEDAFNDYPEFNKFNLSNIFEYMDEGLFKSTCDKLVEHCSKGGVFAYWNLMVPRRMHQVNNTLIEDETLNVQLRAKDKGFFYGGITIDRKA